MRPRSSLMKSSIAGFTLLLGLAFLSISSVSGQSSINLTLTVSPSPPPTLIPTIPADNVLGLRSLKSVQVTTNGNIIDFGFRNDPSGDYLIFVNADEQANGIGLLNTETGAVDLQFFKAEEQIGYRGVSISVDGQRVLGAGQTSIFLWDGQTGEILEQYTGGYRGDIKLGGSLALTADGQSLIDFTEDGLGIINLNDNTQIRLLRSAALNPIGIVTSMVEPWVATFDVSGAVHRFNIETGEIEFRTYPMLPKTCYADTCYAMTMTNPLTFSPDNQYLAWRVQSGVGYKPTSGDQSFPSPSEFITDPIREQDIQAFTFSPDSRYLVVADGNNQLRIWDIANEQEVYRNNIEPAGHVTALAFNQAGTLLAAAVTGPYSDTGTLTGYITLWSVGS